MNWLFNLPLELRLVLVTLIGIVLGAKANWAIGKWAWFPRPLSPWLPAPDGLPARTWADCIPLFGWLRLRREAVHFGRGFWIRPLLVELLFGVALAALYWWEVDQQALIAPQGPFSAANLLVPAWVLHAVFASHTVLLWLMVVAALIDVDEKIIPDEITVLGTLVGLCFATVVPMSLLPHVSAREAQPLVGVAVENVQPPRFVEPVAATAPRAWSDSLRAAPNWQSLAIALGCYWLWCFALAPRIWRRSRGPITAVRMIALRVWRELVRPKPLVVATVGSLLIAAVWSLGFWGSEGAWLGLLTALIGLVGSGGIVWAVRIVGSAAMGREAMGFGDVTLMMMIGTFLGWQACLIVFFLAPLAGIVLGLLQFILRRDDVIPYGPFLCLAAGGTVVCWAPIWLWAKPIFAIGWLVPAALVVCLVLLGLMLALWQQVKKLLLGR